MKKSIFITSTDIMMMHFLVPHIRHFRSLGYDVTVACSDVGDRVSDIKAAVDNQVKVHVVNLVRNPFTLSNIKGYNELKEIINNGNFTHVLTNEPVMGVMTRLASKNARKRGTKVIYTSHGFHFYEGASIINWLIYYTVEMLMQRYTDKLVTVNNEDYKFAKKKYKIPVCIIPGVGVSDERYFYADEDAKNNLRDKLGYKKDAYIIIASGELNDNKNQKMIIDAIELLKDKMPNVKLLLAGKGVNKDFLVNCIKSKNLTDKVNLIGYKADLENYVQMSDMVVSASIREGLGLNIIEAMATGKPVVASLNRGHKELIKSGENGFLFDLNNTAEFADRIFQIYNDKNLSRKFSKKTLEMAKPFMLPNILGILSDIYII